MSASRRPWRRRLTALRRLDGASRRLAAEATVALTLARLLVVALPVRTVALRLAARRPAGHGDMQAALPVARSIARMIGSVSRALPFRAQCLEQAVAATALLHRRGIPAVIHLGTKRDVDGFAAHAWVSVGGTVVVGAPVDLYTEIARF